MSDPEKFGAPYYSHLSDEARLLAREAVLAERCGNPDAPKILTRLSRHIQDENPYRTEPALVEIYHRVLDEVRTIE